MEAIWTMTGDISRFSLPRAAMLKALCAQMRMCRNLNLSRLLGCGAARPLIALNLYTIPIVGDSWVSPGGLPGTAPNRCRCRARRRSPPEIPN